MRIDDATSAGAALELLKLEGGQAEETTVSDSPDVQQSVDISLLKKAREFDAKLLDRLLG